MILQLIATAACCAAFVPAVVSPRQSLNFFQKVVKRFARKSVTYAPPAINVEAGWTMIHCEDPESFREWLGKDVEGLPFREGESPSLGSHLLIELFDCDPASLKTELVVGEAMLDAAIVSKATVVADSFREFQPYGVSGAVIIQESHYTIHTWPEHKYAAVDLFYCGGTIHVQRAVEVLMERFKPQRMKFLVVRRGSQNEVERA